MAAYSAPTPIVEFAPATTIGGTGFSPTRLPAAGDWVALTIGGKSRLLGFENDRGRRTELDQYDSGTATFLLDNTDGQLDEYRAGSLVEGNKGASWTPIRFRMTNAYTGTTSTIWMGFIVDGWESVSGGLNRRRTVRVKAVDFMGWAAQRQMPQSNIASAIADHGTETYMWWRGRLTRAIITSAGGYAIDSGFYGTATGTPISTHQAEQIDSLVDSDNDPAFRLREGCRLATPAAVTAGGFGTWSVWCVFRTGEFAFGRTILSGRTGSSTGAFRWRLRIGTNGNLEARWYDAAATVVGTATIAVAHNDSKPHFVVATWKTAATATLNLYSDLGTATTGALGTPVGEGGYILSGENTTTDDRILLDEVAYFPGVQTYPGYNMQAAIEDVYDASLWSADTISVRWQRLLDMAKQGGSFTGLTLNIKVPIGLGATAVGGFIAKDTFGGALTALAESLAGSAFTPRSGDETTIYGYGDRGAAWFTAAPITFTNDPAVTTGIRYVSSGRTGRQMSRIINEVRSENGTVLAFDATSILAYGVQTLKLASLNQTTTLNGYAASIVAARKDPTNELGELTIQPWGSQTATTWLLESCELGRQVTYVEKSPDNTSTLWSSSTLRVQGESWSIGEGAGDWTVKLKLA